MLAPVPPSETSSTLLGAAAFGAVPIRSAAELPEPGRPLEKWWRAVALGGAGHYAAARVALRRLRSATSDPVLLSLAASTEGSLLRQLGWHARAAHHDGRAAALALPALPPAVPASCGPLPPGAGTPPDGYGTAADILEAAADALIGLAADALGTGRLALATRLLDRCAALLDSVPDTSGYAEPAGPDRPRVRVRLHWVRAETALAGGRADTGLAEAEAALALSESGPSVRHQVKSRLLVAAAAGATGDTDRSAALAALVDQQCRTSGLVPLRWACALLRSGLRAGDAATGDTAESDASACRELIARRGGRFRDAGR
ncbi:hypothetical protein [Nocardia sp. X0981]